MVGIPVSVVVVVDTLYSHMDTYGVPVGVCSQQARYALLWVLRYTSCSYLRYCRMVICHTYGMPYTERSSSR